MLNLPNLRVGGYSTFFDNDLTYFHLGQDIFILLSFIALTWNLLDFYQTSCDHLNPSLQVHEVSVKTLILYSLALTTRLAEYYPFLYFSYDFATCIGFAVIFWIATAIWMYYNYRQQSRTDSVEQDNTKDGHLPSQLAIIRTGRPVWLHFTVGITAMLAYLYNYSHLALTPKLFLWAWSHYLDGVAMIPQMCNLVVAAHGDQCYVSLPVWIGVNLMALSKIFQLLDWAYLWVVADMLDVLAVVSAVFYLTVYGVFRVIVFIKSRIHKRNANVKENIHSVLTVTESKPKSSFTTVASNTIYN